VKDLSFGYNSKRILENIEFEAVAGKMVGILGPNGAGKTTLLKNIARILNVPKNAVFINEKEVRTYSGNQLAKEVAYVPQIVSISKTKVIDAILIGRKPYIDWSITKEDLRIVSEIIVSLGLEKLSMKFIDEISGGELQKVQIARALAQQPNIMLFDEPTNFLDISNQWKFMNLLANLTKSKNICTIVSMHDINTAIRYVDEIIFMKSGNIVAHLKKEDVTSEIIKTVFDVDTKIIKIDGLPIVIPVI
jgi:iron complex transport system ATP-binding protein